MIDLSQIFNDTISGIIINLPWFVLFYIGFRMISKEIKESSKNIPKWLESYFKLRDQQLRKEWALGKAIEK